MNNTILVTGGAGAIGSQLTYELAQDASNHVIVLDNLSSGHAENLPPLKNISFVQGSVESDEDLNQVFSTKIDVIFHLAANFANQNSVDFPQRDLQVNGMGTLKLLQRAQQQDLKRFVYTSSSCVYGNRNEPLSEKCREYSLDTPYAVTKLLGEQYVHFFQYHHKLPAVILRYFNVYGPNEYPGRYRNVMANFLLKAMNDEDLVITGTGEETRDFNFVKDSVRATILSSQCDEAIGKIFNVAPGRETSINQLVEIILKVTGSKSKVIYKERRDWDSVLRRVAAVDEAKQVLNYEPEISIEEGVTAYYEWMKSRDMSHCKW